MLRESLPSSRAKFSYVSFKDIQQYINDGKINACDIVYTKDTHENIFIAPDLSINRVRAKIYRFVDVASAEKELNAATDTYEGQIVAINSNGSFLAYIVNKNKSGSFYVTEASKDTRDYNELANRPIENLTGSLSKPIIISDLASGIYKVRGQYKLCTDDLTTYLSSNEHMFLVNSDGSTVTVGKITSSTVSNYTIVDGTILSSAEMGTKEWVVAQGYATENYVDAKIAALDCMTKAEVEDYVTMIIETEIQPLIDNRIDAKLKASFKAIEDETIDDMF